MKVSIITICYNSASTIEATIQSVIAQEYHDIEYIIIDGASKDDTISIVNKYREQIARIISEPDQGIYDAMNKGVKAASGDVIGILNSDDIYADTHVIDDIVKTFRSNKCDAVYADLVYVDREDTSKVIRYWKSGKYEEGKFLNGWMPPHPTFFVKREVYESHGIYNTSFRSAADYEFMLRVIHKFKISLAYLPRVITKMRVGGESNVTLKNRIRANKEDRRAWEINQLQPRFYTLFFKPLSKLIQFVRK
ncbi:MAG: glycosyltransferase family 2 protein [Flavobacteriales bacterium]